jgi:23S rRNA (guanosine2251-2'-O)-methyltransferase
VGLDGESTDTVDGLKIATDSLYVIVGSEGKGLSRLVREKCDVVVSIPMRQSVESLNASVAMAIALYTIEEKRQKTN